MEKQTITEQLKKMWYSLSMKRKIFVFTGVFFFIIVLSVVLNVWVIKFLIVDFNGILEENAKVSELVQALDEETEMFSEYIKTSSKDKQILLNKAIYRTNQAVNNLTYDYSIMKEARYALTWSIQNSYAVYENKRDLLLDSGGESINYINDLYVVYEMQAYLREYAGNMLTITIAEGNEKYKKVFPDLIAMSFFLLIVEIICVWGIVVITRLMYRAIIVPVVKLGDASKKIADSDFDVENVKVDNKDELGELVHAFNKMKYSTKEYIVALEEKRHIQELLHEEELEKLAMERELDKVRFDLLKNQINPHFLFNTLNVIAGMANLEEADISEKMIRALSDLFRYNLKTNEAEVPLSRELKVIEDYMYLQQMRFGKRITYEIECEVDKDKNMVPVFTFQPIVENAIIHGLSKKEEGGQIRIFINERDGKLCITISDTGVGMPPEILEKIKGQFTKNDADYYGIGLGNVFKRVKTMYEGAEVEIFTKEQVGTVVRLELPKRNIMQT